VLSQVKNSGLSGRVHVLFFVQLAPKSITYGQKQLKNGSSRGDSKIDLLDFTGIILYNNIINGSKGCN